MKAGKAQALTQRLEAFSLPRLRWLDAQIDKRLVRTFLLSLQGILMLRQPRCGLLLSELGA